MFGFIFVQYSQPGVTELQNKIAELVKQDHALTRLQSKGAVDPALFRERHNRIVRQLEETREKLRPLLVNGTIV